jgi:hypothetical protein
LEIQDWLPFQPAYQRHKVRLVRRITMVIDLLVHHVLIAVLCER